MSTIAKKQFSLATSTSRAISQLPRSPLVVESIHPRIIRWEPGCEGSPIPQSRAIALFRKPQAIRIPNSPIGFGCKHFSSFAATILKSSPALTSTPSESKLFGLGIDLLRLVSIPSSSTTPSIGLADYSDRDISSPFISLPNPFPAPPIGLGISVPNADGSLGSIIVDEEMSPIESDIGDFSASRGPLLSFRMDRPQMSFDSPAW